MKTVHSLAKQAKGLWEKRDLDGFLSLHPFLSEEKDARAFYFVGLAQHARGHIREAIELWRQAGELNPRFDPPLRALAYELAQRHHFVEAAESFYQLVALGKATADDLTALGEILIKQGRLADARKYLEKALAEDEENCLALLAMANLFALFRDEPQALKYLQRVVKTRELDLTDLREDPDYLFLWHNPVFEQIVSPTTKAKR